MLNAWHHYYLRLTPHSNMVLLHNKIASLCCLSNCKLTNTPKGESHNMPIFKLALDIYKSYDQVDRPAAILQRIGLVDKLLVHFVVGGVFRAQLLYGVKRVFMGLFSYLKISSRVVPCCPYGSVWI